MQGRGRFLKDRTRFRVDVRLSTRAGETSSICVLRELSDLPALVAFRMRELLSEEISEAGGIVGKLCLELFDGDEMQFHG